MALIAVLAWAKESFSVATTLALSVVDFSKAFQIEAGGRRRSDEFVEVEVGGADVKKDLGEGAHVGRWDAS